MAIRLPSLLAFGLVSAALNQASARSFPNPQGRTVNAFGAPVLRKETPTEASVYDGSLLRLIIEQHAFGEPFRQRL
jgi:hypothetical protein